MTSLHIFLLLSAVSGGKRQRLDSDSSAPSIYSRAVSIIGETSDGRLIEEYNTTIVGEYYGDWLADSLQNLQKMDMNTSMMLPYVGTDRSEMTIYGYLVFNELIARTFQSNIFSIQGNSRKIIKYQSNCGELGFSADLSVKPNVHPSVVEFAFTRKAASYGLSPNALLLSPPVRLCDSSWGKCNFGMSGEEFYRCKSDQNASLRYMIMDRVEGETLFQYTYRFANNTVPFARAMEIGIQLIELIERLHTDAEIGHGDIHESNVMIESDTGNLKLIDFARSYSTVDRPCKKIRPTLWSRHPLYSYRELLGFIPAKIDDVLRAVETVARLMNPDDAYNNFLSLKTAENPTWILDWKSNGNIFEIPSQAGALWEPHDPVNVLGLDEDATSLIKSTLLHLLDKTRHPAPGEPIPYALIRAAFSTCFQIATR